MEPTAALNIVASLAPEWQQRRQMRQEKGSWLVLHHRKRKKHAAKFQTGSCTRGKDCPYSHAAPTAPVKPKSGFEGKDGGDTTRFPKGNEESLNPLQRLSSLEESSQRAPSRLPGLSKCYAKGPRKWIADIGSGIDVIGERTTCRRRRPSPHI